MASGPSYKALAIAKNLQSDLNQRYGAGTWALSSDPADGYPVLQFGTLASDSQTALIKINTQLSSAIKDSLGLQQTAFTPHVAQLVIESTTSTITGAGILNMQAQNSLRILADVASFVNRTELYLHAHGTAISLSDITGQPAQVFETQIQYPGTADV